MRDLGHPSRFQERFLDEEIVFGIQVVGWGFLPHYVHARAQTVEDAVYLADGRGDPVFDRVLG